MHDFRQNPAGNAAVPGERRTAITTQRHRRHCTEQPCLTRRTRLGKDQECG
jgi:hypothetical protein